MTKALFVFPSRLYESCTLYNISITYIVSSFLFGFQNFVTLFILGKVIAHALDENVRAYYTLQAHCGVCLVEIFLMLHLDIYIEDMVGWG